MEENKKEEIQEESQETALLEPRIPYKREVKTDDTATDSEDTATENAATP